MATETTKQVIIQALRDSAGLRSAAYLSAMVGVLWASYKVPYDPKNPFQESVHPIAFPGVVAITGLFARLRPEDRAAWQRQPTSTEFTDLARGLALGTAASLSVLGIASARGWVSAPDWGWAESGLEPSTVVASAALSAAQTALIVFDEEVIFRGYGFDQLRAAIGLPAALVVSALLFARYHGPGWHRLLSLSAAGLLLSFLRLRTGDLWLAAGFHYGWNVTQKSLFGPQDGAPSLCPLKLHGPAHWIGRPGHPDPGWLQTLATIGMAVTAGVAWWWRG